MSDKRDPNYDQQLPVVNDGDFIQDMVIADIEARKRLGIDKYGTALQANNGRNMLQDAYEEAMDLTIYLKGRLEEERLAEERRRDVEEEYAQPTLPGFTSAPWLR